MTKKTLLHRLLLLHISIFMMAYMVSCETDGNGNMLPVNLETTEVDYVGSERAFFKADISGTVTRIDEMGFCWSTEDPPTLEDESVTHPLLPGIFNYTVSGLEPETTYHMRSYFIHQGVTHYSETVSFTTQTTVSDSQENSYEVVKIGDQLWMGQNLRVTQYNNGEPISDGSDRGNYAGMQTPRFYFNYDDDPANSQIYGKLYTWYVATDTRGICPAGWRLPDVEDWENLVFHLDIMAEIYDDTDTNKEISPVAGGLLRSTGTLEEGTGIWHSPNDGASNITRMGLFPSGVRDPSGPFEGKGYNAALWSFTEHNLDRAVMFYTHYFNPGIHANNFPKASGYAVRCMKDAN